MVAVYEQRLGLEKLNGAGEADAEAYRMGWGRFSCRYLTLLKEQLA